MYMCFKAGDRFYAKDFAEEKFLGLQQKLTDACMRRDCRFTVEEGRDSKGYYITLASKVDTRHNSQLYSLQYRKKEELDYALEVAVNQPVMVDRTRYACDNLSVVRMIMFLKAYEEGFMLKEWIDADNVVHTKDINLLLIAILKRYQERNMKLDKIYKELSDAIFCAKSETELQKVSFKKLLHENEY